MQPGRFFTLPVVIFYLFMLNACGHPDQQTSSVAPDNLANIPGESDSGSRTSVLTTVQAAIPDIVGETSRISVDSTEQEANGNSINGSISADGRYVVFDSIATNLTSNDTNSTWDIFLRDRLNQNTIKLTASPTGDESDGASIDPVISDNGAVVIFSSSATNLVDDDSNQVADIFRFDMISASLDRISINQDSEEGNNDSDAPDVSADGRYIVFESNATNLVSDMDSNNSTDIFLFDSITGEMERISINSEGEEGNGISRNPSVSDDGRYVVFDSLSDNLVNDDNNNASDIFLRDRLLGETHRINIGNNNDETNGDSETPVISGNGTVVAFRSIASNLVDNDNNNVHDIFVRDLNGNVTARISVNSSGAEGNASTFASTSIDESGRFVVFLFSVFIKRGLVKFCFSRQ
ncbi:TolB family protein [Kaarinaea lacus]